MPHSQSREKLGARQRQPANYNTLTMINLYWPIYQNLEQEVVELSNQIHFDDKQLEVYSVKISELLIRCVVEIEAIAKELYLKNGGENIIDRDLYFDTDCLNLLEKKWSLSKKIIIVSSANFYFQLEENKVLTPLKKANKRGTSSADWKKAYQEVKHNRTANLSKGSIKHLLRAMGALFLLNLYHRTDVFELSGNNSTNFADNLSEIFNIKVHKWRGEKNEKDSYVKHTDFDECTYLIKWTNEHKNSWSKFIIEQGKNLNEIIFNHPKVKQHINNNLIENGEVKLAEFDSFIQNGDYFKLFDMKREYGNMINTAMLKASQELSFDYKKAQQFEAVLNMSQQIYPHEITRSSPE